MTPVAMMKLLKEYLEQLTKEMFFGPHRLSPNVYMVDLPPRAVEHVTKEVNETDIPPVELQVREDRDERWPFIVIYFNDAEDNEEGYRTPQIDFIFGVEGRGPDGYMDVLHLMETVRASFLRETYEGWPFQLVKPLNMGFYEEQSDPFWTGYISTNWATTSIQPEVWKNGYE